MLEKNWFAKIEQTHCQPLFHINLFTRKLSPMQMVSDVTVAVVNAIYEPLFVRLQRTLSAALVIRVTPFFSGSNIPVLLMKWLHPNQQRL
jgi:hypothetical protein